jgi:hypothetical protein
MELDSNIDSKMHSSARFLVQLPQNRPCREHDACAEHHGNVADFDIETANPYFVEMHTDDLFSVLAGMKKKDAMKAPNPIKVSSKPAPVQAPLAVGNEKSSSSPGAGEEAHVIVDKKKMQEAKRAAKQNEVLKEREKNVAKQNEILKKKKEQDEAYRRQMQKEEQEKNKASTRAGDFTHGRNPVRANGKFKMRRR